MRPSSSLLLLLVVVCALGGLTAATGPSLTAGARRSCYSCEGTKGGVHCNDPFGPEARVGVVPKICEPHQHYCYKLHNPDKSFDRGCTDETCPNPREAAKGDAWVKINYCSVCETDMCNAAVRPAGPSAALLLAALLTCAACLQFPWLRRRWWP